MNTALSPSEELPLGWTWKKLDNVCNFTVSKKDIHRSDLTPTIYLPLNNVNGEEGIIEHFEVRPYSEVKKYPAFVPGAVLFAKISPALENGKCVIVPELENGDVIGFGSTEFITLLPKQEVTSEWVHAYLRRPSFRRLAAAEFPETISYRRVPQRWLKAVSIPVPTDLSIQRKIINRLNGFNLEIRECQASLKRGRILLSRVFPSTLNETLQELRRNNPICTLGGNFQTSQISNIIWGEDANLSDISLNSNGLPYISGPADFGERFPSSSRCIRSHHSTCNYGDILVTIRGEGVGKLNFAPQEEMAIGRQLAAIRPNPTYLSPDFLYYTLLAKRNILRGHMTGIAVRGIRRSHLQAVEIILPSLQVQKKCAQYLESIERELIALAQDITKQEQQLAQMQEDAFSQAFRGLI